MTTLCAAFLVGFALLMSSLMLCQRHGEYEATMKSAPVDV
jgi:hypothetical protein